jgi:hypothetical protein
LSKQSWSGHVRVNQGDKSGAKGGELVGQHGVLAGQSVDEYTGEGSTLGGGVAFSFGEGKMEEGRFPAPEGFSLVGAVVSGRADRAAGQVAVARGVVGGAHGEVEVVYPCGDVHWVRKAGEVPSHGQDQ